MAAPALALALFAFLLPVRPLPSAHAARQGAPAAGASVRIDAERQLADLAALASPALEGRRTGSDGNRRARALIVERFRQVGLQPLNGSFVHPFSFRETRPAAGPVREGANVVGTVRGTRTPASFVLVSAHYDHLGVQNGVTYPGADDNASGVAALLSLASWFAAHPGGQSLIFAAFDAEEQGLQGARHFTADPPIDLQRITAVVNVDMIGRGDRNVLFAAGTRHYPALKPFVTEAARGRSLILQFGHDGGGGGEDWTNSSDHGPFHAAGIPFLYFGVEDHPDYHKPTDTADKIPREFYLEATRLVLDVVARLAERGAA